MKRILLSLVSLLLCAAAARCADITPVSLAGYDPVADPAALVLAGNARFTVLTDRLIRMEWSEDGVFEDRATLAVVNRRLPVPEYKVTTRDDVIFIRTRALTLAYRGGGRFDAGNLSVTFRLNGRQVTWRPGADDSGNLLGTTRTLDGCLGWSKISSRDNYIEKGILSRDGWAIVDESSRHILVPDSSDWGEWVAPRPEGDRQDLYIFAYGHDYTGALSDFTKVAGRIPLPPKYAFGYWWSRYWAYTDEELLEICQEMKEHAIPLDVFIVDMDWHNTMPLYTKRSGGKDEFGQRVGWTGYTWNRDLFPDPEGFLREIHSYGYKTALNLHPASGIRPLEDCYDDFRDDYLSRTDDYDGPKEYIYGSGGYLYKGNVLPVGKKGYRAAIPFRIDQQAWADAYFNSVIHPLERQGVDFWWLDWQQWPKSRYVEDLSNTFWLNYTFFNDKVRQTASEGKDADRAMIYHRWGGLGSHRYQLGFSGDTYDEWSVLEFLPYFTSTASNVCYGYWGHDMGGHMQQKNHQRLTEPEMFTRWVQFGVFTPIFKTHSTASANLERRIWAFPGHFEYLRDAIELRYALSPYIYDAARQAYDTGVSMCRPLYYYFPEDDRAYTYNQEYMFGDNILATVVCSPADPDTGLSDREMWFPQGCGWYDMAAHVMRKGGTVQTLRYAIDQNPWFVREGAMVPLASEEVMNLQDQSTELRLLIVPGSGNSSYVHYEDDGETMNYLDSYARTQFTRTAVRGGLSLVIGAREGGFGGALQKRNVTLLLEGISRLPKSVKVNGGESASCSLREGRVEVVLPESSVNERTVVDILY